MFGFSFTGFLTPPQLWKRADSGLSEHSSVTLLWDGSKLKEANKRMRVDLEIDREEQTERSSTSAGVTLVMNSF